ncbi:hypothetical protein [uncultured Kordia sp.]|uniref:hypothetical protein n=1 Tax=uncultured Kordia sp. TaxID=507699 RepID=UPI0026396ED8|nr:hypothetical protein [uncultured Kordia sp.]
MGNKLTNLENNYYYGFTRSFWHVIISILFLSLIGGVIMIGWSFIPSSKRHVVKTAPPVKQRYPKQVAVTTKEVLQKLPKEKEAIKKVLDEQTKIANTPPVNQEVYVIEDIVDTLNLTNFNNEIANLKLLIPVKKYSSLWNPKGYYTYPQGKRKYDVTKNEKYRKWVVLSQGLKDQIISKIDAMGFKSYKEKYQLLKTYNQCLAKINTTDRELILKKLLSFFNKNKVETINAIEHLTKLLPLFDENITQVFDNESYFIKKNPQDGLGMIAFETKILPNFTKEDRLQAAKVLKSEYLNFYDYNLSAFTETTQNFITMLPKVSKGQEAVALQYFYEVYRSKNAQRIAQIRTIDNNYQQRINSIENKYQADIKNAQLEYNAKVQKKTFWRLYSFWTICSAIGSVLVVTLILLMLSMIRNVNKLASVLLLKKENN